MHQPAPGWLTRAGYDFGHNVLPLLAILAVIVVAGVFLARRWTAMHDPQVLTVLVAVLAALFWRAALKLLIAVIAIGLTAILVFAALGLGHYLLHVLR
jgi:hypothetical protein